jgi:cytidylate kinase
MNPHEVSLSVARALMESHAEAGGPAARAPARPPLSIAFSREPGAMGTTVARAVGRELGWPVYDRELVDRIGAEMRQSPELLASIDERRTHWLEEALANLLGTVRVHADAYLKYLVGTVRGLGEVGHAILVGRAAHCILAPESTLLVRLVADPRDRVHNLMRDRGMSEREATAWAERTAKERVRFVRDVFGKDPTNPLEYDLVLNMSRLSVDDAAAQIVDLARRRERRAGGATR